MRAKPGRSKRRLELLLVIFFVAFSLRAVYLFEYSQSVHWDLLSLDPFTHHLWAKEIAETDFIGHHPFFRAPLYPYVVGVAYSVFGSHLIVPRLINIICGALSCVLLFLIGERFFRRTVGLVASVVACLYWMFIYFEGELLLEPVYLCLLLLFLYLLVLSEGKKSVKLVAAGFVLGLATITRPNVLVYIPFALVWLALANRPKGWRTIVVRASYFIVPALIIIFSVTARNHLVGNDAVFIAYQGGINFYIGNNPHAKGHLAEPQWDIDEIPDSYKQKHADNIWLNDDVWLTSYFIAERDMKRELKPSEVQKYWFRKSFDFIWNNKADFLGLLLKKTYYFFNAYEIPSNKDPNQFIKENSWLLRVLSILDFGIIISLGVLGMIVSLGRARHLFLLHTFVLVYVISTVAFFVNARFRVPTIPFLILFAVFFVFWLAKRIKAGKLFQPALATAACVGLLVFTHTDRFGLRDDMHQSSLHFNLGTALKVEGEYEASVAEFLEAIRLYPYYAQPYIRLCHVYLVLNKPEEAIAVAKRGAERFPDNPEFRFRLGTGYLQKGELEKAAVELERAVDLAPDNAGASMNLGITYFKMGQLQKATRQFENTLTKDTDESSFHLVSHLHLGFIALQTENYEEAKNRFEEVLRMDPRHVYARLNLAIVHFRLRNSESARDELQKVLQLDPNNQRALGLLKSMKLEKQIKD